MNLYAMVVGLFKTDLSAQFDSATLAGQRDGTAIAEAYCDGFFPSAQEVFQRRLGEFQNAHIEADEPPKRIKNAPITNGKRSR